MHFVYTLSMHICLLQFGINLDPAGDGFGGADFGLMLTVKVTPLLKMLNPKDAETPLFEFGGPDSGMEANFDVYIVSDNLLHVLLLYVLLPNYLRSMQQLSFQLQ